MLEKLKAEFKEKIWENEHILKARQKFLELDAQTQSYVIIGAFAFFVVVLLASFVGFLAKTSSMKSDLEAMDSNIRLVQVTAARIEELKALARNDNRDPLMRDFDITLPLGQLTERAVQKALVPKASIEALEEKGGGVELKLAKISLHQVVRILYLLEQSNAGVVVEKLNIDAKDDPEGYLWASFNLRKVR